MYPICAFVVNHASEPLVKCHSRPALIRYSWELRVQNGEVRIGHHTSRYKTIWHWCAPVQRTVSRKKLTPKWEWCQESFALKKFPMVGFSPSALSTAARWSTHDAIKSRLETPHKNLTSFNRASQCLEMLGTWIASHDKFTDKSENVHSSSGELKINFYTLKRSLCAITVQFIQRQICWISILQCQQDKTGCSRKAVYSEVFFVAFEGVQGPTKYNSCMLPSIWHLSRLQYIRQITEPRS